MKVQLNRESILWLRDHRVFFEPSAAVFRLNVGDTLSFRRNVKIEPYCGILEGQTVCDIGAFSFSRSHLPEGLTIGRYCSIGPNLSVPRPRHPWELLSTSSFIYDAESSLVSSFITDKNMEKYKFYENSQKPLPALGNDIWIGDNVAILPGVVIGDGAVVASNSVVVKNVDPYTIVGGNPAQIIRLRFPASVIEALLRIRWWRYGFDLITRFDLSNIEHFVESFSKQMNGFEEYRPDIVPLADIPAALI